MSINAMNLVCEKIKRFGYTKCNKPSNKEELGKIVSELLVPFDDPVVDTIGDINYSIVAGVFDIFTTYLIYQCPTCDPNKSYAAHITHRDDDKIRYTHFPIYGYHPTFEQAVESITGIFAIMEKLDT